MLFLRWLVLTICYPDTNNTKTRKADHEEKFNRFEKLNHIQTTGEITDSISEVRVKL